MILKGLYENQQKIQKLQKELSALKIEYEYELAGVICKGITNENGYVLKTTYRKQNTINANMFRESYPEIFDKIAHVQRKYVVKELSKAGHNTTYIEQFLE